MASDVPTSLKDKPSLIQFFIHNTEKVV